MLHKIHAFTKKIMLAFPSYRLLNQCFIQIQDLNKQQATQIKMDEFFQQEQKQLSAKNEDHATRFADQVYDRFLQADLSYQQQLKDKVQILEEYLNVMRESLSAEFEEKYAQLIRNEILSRWQVVDSLDTLRFPENYQVACGLCGHTDSKKNYKTIRSNCIFNGGELERYICPRCGVIFGPLKMNTMTQSQLASEYRQSYTVFSESDCTRLEELVFKALNPDRSGVFLNYGAGAWASTSQKLREQGYTVYNYEPFAPVAPDDFLITDERQLLSMRFDGIFSNDLIEHLLQPSQSLLFMKSLLKEGGKMAHGSGCYDYAFEYTRFHLFFFVENSLDFLSKKIEMKYNLSDHLLEGSPFRICSWQ